MVPFTDFDSSPKGPKSVYGKQNTNQNCLRHKTEQRNTVKTAKKKKAAMVRRSKRKATVLENLTKGHGGLRRSKRKLALREYEQNVFGDDCGVLPSD